MAKTLRALRQRRRQATDYKLKNCYIAIFPEVNSLYYTPKNGLLQFSLQIDDSWL
jgi:hypothetical protein